MERIFEKISFAQFKKDIIDDNNLYNEYKMPKRQTKSSAGYDFYAISDFTIKKGESLKIPTGMKIKMKSDEVLLLIVRSSMGFKYNVRMCNQVGVLDSDYYNNEENEGHAWIKLQNEGEKDFTVKKGDAFCQGIFVKYLTVDNEEEIDKIRKGGLGSTNKESE